MKEVSLNYTKDAYVLKLDIQVYFMAIEKNILIKKVSNIFTKEKFLSSHIVNEGDLSYGMLLELFIR